VVEQKEYFHTIKYLTVTVVVHLLGNANEYILKKQAHKGVFVSIILMWLASILFKYWRKCSVTHKHSFLRPTKQVWWRGYRMWDFVQTCHWPPSS